MKLVQFSATIFFSFIMLAACAEDSKTNDNGRGTGTEESTSGDTNSSGDADSNADSDSVADSDSDENSTTDTEAESDLNSDAGDDTNSGLDSDTNGETDTNNESVDTERNVAPYANVTGIPEIEGEAGAYTFHVTVESADIDCDQFADWWEVLNQDGELLYRRILQHCHTDENGTSDPDAPGNSFTRDGGPIAINADEVVIVRAHMSNGGYNGAVMRGSVESGFAEAPDITSEFASDVENESPLPETCMF